MSGSTTWVSGSGTWGVGSNWGNGAPTASTNATISGSASETITIAAGSVAAANTLTLNDANAVLLDLGSLAVTSMTLTAGTLEFGGGTASLSDGGAAGDGIVNHGTITTTGTVAGTVSISGNNFTNAGQFIDNVDSFAISDTSFANSGTMTVIGTEAITGTVTSTNNTATTLSMLGAIVVDGTTATNNGLIFTDGGDLTFDEATSVTNTGTLSSNATTYTYANLSNKGKLATKTATVAGTLTLDTGTFTNSNQITLAGSTILVEGAQALNAGTITLSGGTLDIASSIFTNTGRISESAGVLTIGEGTSVTGPESTFSSTGSISITGGSVILDGTVTDANLSSITRGTSTGKSPAQEGTLVIGGVLNNTSTLNIGTGTVLGTLTVGTGFNPTNYANYGGEIDGGTIHDAGGGLIGNFGTLTNLTYEGTLSLSGVSAAQALILDGVTLTTLAGGVGGTIVDGSGNKEAYFNTYVGFVGDTTLSNLHVTMGAYLDGSLGTASTAYGYSYLYSYDAVGSTAPITLTLGSSVTINEASVSTTKSGGVVTQHEQSDRISAGSFIGDTLINQGTIIANQALADFDIEAQVLINAGTIAVSGGGTLEINTGNLGPGYTSYSATDTGTITSVNSYVELGGTLTSGFLQHLTATGGHTYLQSYAYAYNYTGSGASYVAGTFAIGSGATGVANQLVLGGTILGGTIVDSGSGLIADGGALDGVTYQGNFDPLLDTTVRYGYTDTDSIYIQDGITLETPTMTLTNGVSLYGGSSYGTVANNELDNITINIGVSAGSTLVTAIGEGGLYSGTFTLGAGTVLNDVGTATLESAPGTITTTGTQTGATNTYTTVNTSNVFLNLGTINALGAGDVLNVIGNEFDNAGVVDIVAGARLVSTASSFINTGTIEDAGTLSITGSLLGAGTLDISGTLILGAADNVLGAIDIGQAGADIQVAGVTITSASATLNGDGTDYTVTVDATNTGGAISFALTDVSLAPGATPSISFGVAADGDAYLDIQPCFAQGTRIATVNGGVAVEDLREGDMVVTVSGEAKPVKWIGHRDVACSEDRNPADYWPVRISRDAFGAGLPHTDLLLSPDHAVFVEGALIPVKHLVNRVSITQEPRAKITYWHVELEQHDAILAEGLPCETYLDTGNRNAFANADVVALRPCFDRPAAEVWETAWARAACGTLVQDGPILAGLRSMLASRAVAMGHALPVYADIAIAAASRLRVTVPAKTACIRLRSASARVAGDHRLLGARLGGLTINGKAVSMNDLRLGTGFHAVEMHGSVPARWTDGEATIFLGHANADRVVELDVIAVVDPAGTRHAA